METLIPVTVAPGKTIVIRPHPAGASFGYLELGADDTHLATEEEAGNLYARGIIRHPVTGELRPGPVTIRPRREEGVSIMVNGRQMMPGEVQVPTAAEQAARQARADAEVDKRNATILRSRQIADEGRARTTITDRNGQERDPNWPRLRDQYGEI